MSFLASVASLPTCFHPASVQAQAPQSETVMRQGDVTCGSDSGHQAGLFGRGLLEGARGRGGR